MNIIKSYDLRPKTIFKQYWYLCILALICALSFGLNFYAISKLGFGNAYYAAAIKSMTQSFKNFFFVAFDPAGMVSVDKPPLGLWIQAIFVKILGYHGWVMLLPQALAGTASCIMMYLLTAKYFGRPAGLVSSLVFAVTPALVVAARNNTIDTQLIFVLLLATWFLFKAIEKTEWRYLFICAAMVGLGFNIKMLQAYMILPAIAVVYLIFAKEKFYKRIIAGLISIVIVADISFAWVLAVDLTPAGSRPYVDSSTNNTVSELIIGHNGLERIYGQGGSRGGMPGDGGMRQDGNRNGTTPPSMPKGNNAGGQPNMQNGNGTPPAMPGTDGGRQRIRDGGQMGQGFPGGQDGFRNGQDGRGNFGKGGGIAGNEIGNAGAFRLWGSSLYGQASWLLIFALFCIIAKTKKFSFKNLNIKQCAFLYWILWLLVMYVFFSFASFWHRYYLCMLAPAVAGISGPGLAEMVNAFKNKRGWRQFLLPVSLIATSIFGIIYVWSYTALRVWLVPIMSGAAAVSLILMGLHYFKPKKFILIISTCFMLISLLAAPLYWSMTVTMYPPQNVTMPYAGPELASTSEIAGMTPNQGTFNNLDAGTTALEKYLVANYKEGSFLVVSQRSNDVAQFIVDTGLPAYAYGGFLGSDNSLTLDKLKELVKEGKVTYFLVSGQGGFGGGSSDLVSYVKENAVLIDSSEYSGGSQTTASRSNGVSGSLYLFKS
ncbi:MAG: glycosyltransferase family 39 protein [Bacillota bacterium]|nr:glycosyltransferase family 39 protein [Bacillota bacterium]